MTEEELVNDIEEKLRQNPDGSYNLLGDIFPMLRTQSVKIKALRDLSDYGVNLKEITKYAHESDAGIDLVSCHMVNLPSGMHSLVRTGIAVEPPPGYFGLILPRSGMAAQGVGILAGVIDQGYRGEIIVHMINHSSTSLRFPVGLRIAQLAILPYFKASLEWTEELGTTDRGNKGHGSTGQ